jgi:hypothetical protein
MNNKLTMVVAPMIAFAVLLVSCKKEKDDAGITGRYKMTALVEITAAGEVDQFPLIDDCVKDDVLEFKSNKTYVYTDAGTVCTPSGNDTGTWENAGGNKIRIDGQEITIVSQTATQLVLLNVEDLDGNKLTYKSTYQKL